MGEGGKVEGERKERSIIIIQRECSSWFEEVCMSRLYCVYLDYNQCF